LSTLGERGRFPFPFVFILLESWGRGSALNGLDQFGAETDFGHIVLIFKEVHTDEQKIN